MRGSQADTQDAQSLLKGAWGELFLRKVPPSSVPIQLSQRTLRNALFRVAGATLRDGIALFQTVNELSDGDLAVRHEGQLVAEAVVAVGAGQDVVRPIKSMLLL